MEVNRVLSLIPRLFLLTLPTSQHRISISQLIDRFFFGNISSFYTTISLLETEFSSSFLHLPISNPLFERTSLIPCTAFLCNFLQHPCSLLCNYCCCCCMAALRDALPHPLTMLQICYQHWLQEARGMLVLLRCVKEQWRFKHIRTKILLAQGCVYKEKPYSVSLS